MSTTILFISKFEWKTPAEEQMVLTVHIWLTITDSEWKYNSRMKQYLQDQAKNVIFFFHSIS